METIYPSVAAATRPSTAININWEYLLESIEEEKCVLCLGPGIFDQPGVPTIDQELARFLKEQENDLRIRVYSDGWFHYLPDASEIDAWKKVKEFYGKPNSYGEALLDKIALMPFHFILTFTPDYKTREAFSRQGIPFHAESYLKKMPFDPMTQKPTKNHPLVYNFLGELNKRNSLVMTYTDFYSYLESVFEGNSIAPVLKENIWDADYFVFLGIPFDKWYFHLFMRILQQHDKKRSSKKYAANPLYDDNIAVSCAEQYTMTFVHTDVAEFVQALYKQCAQRGILRSVNEIHKIELELDQLKSWLIHDEFENIFSSLKTYAERMGNSGKDLDKQALLLQAQVDFMRQKMIYGTLSNEEERLEKARIRERILILFTHIEKQYVSS